MELLVLGTYLQDGQAWTVAWKCLIPNNYSFLNISLSPTGNFWWFHCVSLWNSKPSWLQKIRKQLHSKPDFLLSLDCLGIIVQLYVVRKLRKCGFQISLCFPVSQIWKVWCHFWIFYFANLLLKYETPVPYTKQIGVEIKGMFGANLKLYRYSHTKIGETIHILMPLPVGTKFLSVRGMSNFAKPLVEHVFSHFKVNIYRVTTTFPRPWFLSWML